jgi:hypothetical protein
MQKRVQAEMSATRFAMVGLLVRVAWLASSFAIVYSLIKCDAGEYAGECRQLNWMLLGALTFPVGVIWGAIVIGIGFVLEYLKFDPGWSTQVFFAIEVLQAVLVIGLGYLQWFFGIPWAWSRFNSRRGRNASGAQKVPGTN